MTTAAPTKQICHRLLEAYQQRDDEQFAEALKDVANAASALKSVPKIAGEIRSYWDADQDMKVGKIVIALSGRLIGYRSDVDAIHAAIARIEGMAR